METGSSKSEAQKKKVIVNLTHNIITEQEPPVTGD